MEITNRNILKRDLFTIILIVLLPFLFYLYKIIPADAISYDLGIIIVKTGYSGSLDYLLWQLAVKSLTVGILSIWFNSCIHKWRNILLVPIFFEIYKFVMIIDYSINGIDRHTSFSNLFDDNIILLSFVFFSIYATILHFIKLKFKYVRYNKHVSTKINLEINQNLDKVSKITFKDYKQIKEELKTIKSARYGKNKRDYLYELIKLRDKITI